MARHPSPVIAVVDYGAGNLRSVAKALIRSGLDARVSCDPGEVRAADGVVLPGVGAFADAVESLEKTGLGQAVRGSIEAGRPYLGICLGLQLLFDESDEHGLNPGFGLLSGRVEHFPERDQSGSPLRVPHIGWNEVRFQGTHPMLERLPRAEPFYFVHSYRAVPADASVVVGHTEYGGDFAAAVAVGNLFAVQFHPEKSQSAGKRLLDAFAGWVSADLEERG
jgi:glutamine amidotransferase